MILELGDGEKIEFVSIPAGEGLLGGYIRVPVWSWILVALTAIAVVALTVLLVRSLLRRGMRFSLGALVIGVVFTGWMGFVASVLCGQLERLNRFSAPLRTVRFRQPFFLSQCEITKGQYAAYLGTQIEKRERRLPVNEVSWHDAVSFCEWLTKRTGMRCRLPTEDEWEWAARGGTTTRYPSGSSLDDLKKTAWFGSSRGPYEVGLKSPNGYGLYDVCGNVEEWCVDDSSPGMHNIAILKGGGFRISPEGCHLSARLPQDKDEKYECFGFRVLLEATPAIHE